MKTRTTFTSTLPIWKTTCYFHHYHTRIRRLSPWEWIICFTPIGLLHSWWEIHTHKVKTDEITYPTP